MAGPEHFSRRESRSERRSPGGLESHEDFVGEAANRFSFAIRGRPEHCRDFRGYRTQPKRSKCASVPRYPRHPKTLRNCEMKKHLSDRQFAKCLVGRPTGPELQHISECPECAMELDRTRNSI